MNYVQSVFQYARKNKKHLDIFDENNDCTIVGPLNFSIFKLLAKVFLKNK